VSAQGVFQLPDLALEAWLRSLHGLQRRQRQRSSLEAPEHWVPGPHQASDRAREQAQVLAQAPL